MRLRALVLLSFATATLACDQPSDASTAKAPAPLAAEPEPELEAGPKRIHVDQLVRLVDEVEANRAAVASSLGAMRDGLEARDGKAAIAALAKLEPSYVDLRWLFKRTLLEFDEELVADLFELAWLSASVQLEVGRLRGWVDQNGAILSARAGGPSSFVAIEHPSGGVLMGEYVSAICEPMPDKRPADFDPATLRRCEGDEILQAEAYEVRTELGGETGVISAKDAHLVMPVGPVYAYAIGATPATNGRAYFDILVGGLDSTLEQMAELVAEIRSNEALSPAG